MPFYAYYCDDCDQSFDRVLPMSQFNVPQTCPSCAVVARKVVTAPEVVFKGDDWASKNGRIARQMAEKNRKVSSKQEVVKREGPSVRLVPNVNGERMESWSEARSLAKSLGKDASSYDSKVRSEQSAKK